jgi:uncharacterized protein (TIGR02466 family)
MQNLNTEYWFATQVHYKDLDNFKTINKQIIKEINTLKKKDKGLTLLNALGWHSSKIKEGFDVIKNEFLVMQQEIYEVENYNKKTKPLMTDMWVNVNPRYAYNKEHHHIPGSLWSAIYYVSAPKNSGKIFFKDSAIEKWNFNPVYEPFETSFIKNNNSAKEVHYEIYEGRMIMFPSYLVHGVEANLSNKNRISIASNFVQINK